MLGIHTLHQPARLLATAEKDGAVMHLGCQLSWWLFAVGSVLDPVTQVWRPPTQYAIGGLLCLSCHAHWAQSSRSRAKWLPVLRSEGRLIPPLLK